MAALKKKNGLASGPAPSLAQGPSTAYRTPTKRIPAFSRGRGPRTPAIPGFCALCVRSRRLAGGHMGALCPCRVVAARRRGLSCPRLAAWRVPAPRSALRRRPAPCSCALAPSGPGAGGAGLGSLPSLPPAPGGRFHRSRRRGVAGSLVRWFFGGVLWPLSRSFLPRPPCCVPRGLVWLPGRVPPWAFPSAPRRARCVALWLWFVSPRRRARARSPVPGRAACRPLAGVASCARFPPPRAWRPRGWCPCRSRRRPSRFAGVVPRAAWPPCSPLAAAFLPFLPLSWGCAVASFAFGGFSSRAVPVAGGAVLFVCRVPAVLPSCLLFPAAALRPSLLALWPPFRPGPWGAVFVAAGRPVPPLVVRVPLRSGRVVRPVVARLLLPGAGA
jgi:hypothetical protein